MRYLSPPPAWLLSFNLPPFAVVALTLVACLAIEAHAANVYWDGGASNIAGSGDGASNGGDGTWNTTIQNWDQGNGLAHIAYPNVGTTTATFAGTAGRVILTGTFNGSVTVSSSGYHFDPGSDNGDPVFSKIFTVNDGGTTKFLNFGSTTGTVYYPGQWDFKFNGGLSIPTSGTAEVWAGNGGQGSISSLSGDGKLHLRFDNNFQTYGQAISGTNTSFTGNVEISAVTKGVVRLDNNKALGVGGSVTLSGGTLNINGKTVDNPIVLKGGKLAGNGGTVTGIVSQGAGATSLEVASDITLTNSNNTYTVSTNVTSGNLTVNGVTSSNTTVKSGASIRGSGRIGGLILEGNSTLSPGNSPGTLTVGGNATWNANANYNWQVYTTNTNSGVQTGAGTSWDLLDVMGSLTLNGLSSGSRFNINLWSLTGTSPDVDGTIPSWDPNVGSTWLIAKASGGINLDGSALLANSNYSDLFNINTAATNGASGWSGGLPFGGFEVVTLGNTNNLYLRAVGSPSAAVPEPSQVAASLLLLAVIGGYFLVKQRRTTNA